MGFPIQRVLRAAGGGIVAAAMLLGAFVAVPSANADEGSGETNKPVVTDTVAIKETTSKEGFVHPGVGMTANDLNTARTMVMKGVEPWTSYWNTMQESSYAATNWTPRNMDKAAGSVDKPTQQYNVQWMRNWAKEDAHGALTQAIEYVFTGNPVYRANALHAIRSWSNLDPEQYHYFADAHIHTTGPLYQFMIASELIRYTEPVQSDYNGYSLQWSDEDTTKLKKNLVDPHVSTFYYTQNRYLNQHNYGTLAAIAAAIATDDTALYDQRVEWFTVNSTFDDWGDWNGSVKSLFREISADNPKNTTGKTYIQFEEMGRDQAHAWDDILNFSQTSRMLSKQNTKLDPVSGTVFTSANAVDIYHFLNNRILAGTEYFASFDSGLDVPWTYEGNEGNFLALAQDFRGRLHDAMTELYYQYTYVAGVDVEKEAPMVAKAYQQRFGPKYWHASGKWEQKNYWDDQDNSEYWLAFPAELAKQNIQVPTLSDSTDIIAARIGEPLNKGASVKAPTTWQGEDGYVSLDPAKNGTAAFRNMFWTYRPKHNILGIRVKSTGGATVSAFRTLDKKAYFTIAVPDTGNEWRWLTYDIGGDNIPEAQVGDNILFLKASGKGGTVDIDRIRPIDYDGMADRLTPPAFSSAEVHSASISGQTYTASFTAVDSGENDTIAYSLFNAPKGMTINESTGAISWVPSAVGSHEFAVVATDGTSITALPVTLDVCADRASAITTVMGLRSKSSYIKSDEQAISSYEDKARAIAESGNDTEFSQALETLRSAIVSAQLLDPRLNDESLDFPSLVTSPNVKADAISALTDGDNQTYWGNLTIKYLTFDFGPGYQVKANAFGFLARSTFANRAQGTNVYGSNDGINWTLLTEKSTAGDDANMERINVRADQQGKAYRLLRFQCDEPGKDTDVAYPGVWTLGDLRIYGNRIEVNNAIDTVNFTSSAQGVVNGRVVAGDNVDLTFTTRQDIGNVKVTIGGNNAKAGIVSDNDGVHTWKATSTVSDDAETGTFYPFAIDYTTADGAAGTTVRATTDGNSLWVSSDESLIDDALSNSNVLGVDMQPSETVSAGNSILFDGKVGGNNKTSIPASTGEAALVWDLGEGNSFTFSGADVLLQQDSYGTSVIGKLRFEASNDGKNWTQLTDSFTRTLDWQKFKSKDAKTSYRYLRVYNNFQIALTELRVYGTVNIVNKTLSDGSIDYRSEVTSQQLNEADIKALADGSGNTYWGDQAYDSVVLDFGLNKRVQATAFGMQARNNFPDRIKGTNIYGSNDGIHWDLLTITSSVGQEGSVEKIKVASARQNTAYRFLALNADDKSVNQGGNAPGIRNLAELRIWGNIESVPGSLDSVSLSSADGQVRGWVEPGNDATLTFTTKDNISDVDVKIAGQSVGASSVNKDGIITWSASAKVPQDLSIGSTVPFTVAYKTSNGEQATATGTTDGSRLYVSRVEGQVTASLQAATMLDAEMKSGNDTVQWANSTLFDNSIASNSKTNVKVSDNGTAAIVWDLGESKGIAFAGADILIQQDKWGREHIGTLRFEGSNDGKTWAALSTKVNRSLDWQHVEALNNAQRQYRYLRLVDSYQISLMEARVFGTVDESHPTVDPELAPVDESDLQTEVEQAGALAEADYTPESWSAFATALDSARNVLSNSEATQADVDAALAALRAARSGLTAAVEPDPDPDPEPKPVDKSALQQAVDAANKLSQDSYTPETWSVFADALSKAQAVLKNNDATADDVNAAFEALELARAGLVEQTDDQNQGSKPNQQQPTAEDKDEDELTNTGSSIIPVLMIALIMASAGAVLSIASVKRRAKRN